jgi:hypothetical protein
LQISFLRNGGGWIQLLRKKYVSITIPFALGTTVNRCTLAWECPHESKGRMREAKNEREDEWGMTCESK